MYTTEKKATHEGRNVKRIREIMGIKQDRLAYELGLSQQTISQIEQKEKLDKDLLEKIAAVLKVPAEAIRHFDEEKAIYNIQNNYDSSTSNVNYQFNSVDKIVELYEALIKSEREKIELLEKMLDLKKKGD